MSPVTISTDATEVERWICHLFDVVYEATIVEHHIISGLVLLAWGLNPKVPFHIAWWVLWGVPKAIFKAFLRCLGFGEDGVERDSFASRYQSRHYGGYVPEDSLFAFNQSYGAVGYAEISDEGDEDSCPFFWGCLGIFLFGVGVLILFGALKGGRE